MRIRNITFHDSSDRNYACQEWIIETDSQKAWQSAVEAQGYKYVVIRSLDQFMGEVTRYLTK